MRGKESKKRQLNPDPIYKSKVVARVISMVLKVGKKSLAESIVYGSLERLNEDKKEGLSIFEEAVRNIMPQQEVRSRRVGGATYQVPLPLKHERAEALAVRWLVNYSRSKKGKPMIDSLVEEINSAHNGTGDSIKKRDDVHRMAEANRAFAHFARF